MKIVRTAADRLVNLLLPSAVAGACVPENGQRCKCENHTLFRYNCSGACLPTPSYCTS